jgi:hypothetical protein
MDTGVPVRSYAPAAGALSSVSRPAAILVMLFVLSLATDTDIFNADVLQPFGNTLRANGSPNAKGAVLRALILVAAFALISALINSGVV